MTGRRVSSRTRTWGIQALGLPLLGMVAVLGCGRGSGPGTDGGDVFPPSSTGVSTGGGDGGSSEGMPDETDPDCGCDGSTSDGEAGDDGASTSGDGSDAGGSDAGGMDGGADGGDGAGDLQLPPDHGTRGSPGALTVQAGQGGIAPACLHGIVEDERGRRISGATVTAISDGGGGGTAPTLTTGAGHFCIKAGLTRQIAIAVATPSGRAVEQRVDGPFAVRHVHGCVQVRTVVPVDP